MKNQQAAFLILCLAYLLHPGAYGSSLLSSFPPVSDQDNLLTTIDTTNTEAERVTRAIDDFGFNAMQINGIPTNLNFGNLFGKKKTSSFRSIRLYKMWAPSHISETVASDDWSGTESIVEFKPRIHSLINITQAMLNLTIQTLDEDSLTAVPVLLSGGYSFHLSNDSDYVVTTGATRFIGKIYLPEDSNKVSFGITDFIREIESFSDDSSIDKVCITFLIRRQCNSIDGSDCQSVLDVDLGMPFLKVDYRLPTN